jgi:hypothetical protein
VVAGLTVGLVSVAPGRGHPVQPIGRWLPSLLVIGALLAVALLTFRRARGPVRASALGFAGAAVSGLQSALFSASLPCSGSGAGRPSRAGSRTASSSRASSAVS